jgi:hypothetical protein
MCAVVTIKIYFSGTKVTVPYGAPSYTYYLVSYQEVHSFTSFFNRFAIVVFAIYIQGALERFISSGGSLVFPPIQA